MLRVQERVRSKGQLGLFWEVIEVTNSQELRLEGRDLRHCVATYAQACVDGRSRVTANPQRLVVGANSLFLPRQQTS